MASEHDRRLDAALAALLEPTAPQRPGRCGECRWFHRLGNGYAFGLKGAVGACDADGALWLADGSGDSEAALCGGLDFEWK